MQEEIRTRLIAVIEAARSCGMPRYLLARSIGIYLTVAGVCIIRAREAGLSAAASWQDFIRAYPLRMTVMWFLLLFVLVSLFYHDHPSERMDAGLLIGGTLFFSCTLMWRSDNFYFCIGVSLTAAVFIVYGASLLNTAQIEAVSANRTALLTALLCIIVTDFVCVTTIAIHRTFSTTCFDMGIFVQMFHSLSHHLTAVTTCERETVLSHFNVHASYIFYLLVPVYALFPDENTLLIAQAVLTVSGVVPLFLIARHRDFKGLPLLSVCMIYLFSDGLLAPCYYHFHENAFLPPLLLWLLYAVEKRSYILFFVMSALVCIVKEDAPLYVICISLYLFFEERGRNRLYAAAAACASAAYFLFITDWLTKNGDGSMMMATRFWNLTIDQEDGFVGLIGNVLSNPGYFISLFVRESTLLFLAEMLLPLLFLPFVTRRIHRFFLLIPFVIMNLVIGSGYSYAAIMGYQYTFGTSSLLIYMTVINLDDLGRERRNIGAITAAAVSVITAFSLVSGHISDYEHYRDRAEHFQAIEACLDTIPADGRVIASTWYLPHVADRDAVYTFDDNDFEKIGEEFVGLKDMQAYDFYVLSLADSRTAAAVPYLESAGFTVFADCEGAVVIYQNPAYHGVS